MTSLPCPGLLRPVCSALSFSNTYLRHPTLLMQLAGRSPRLTFLFTIIEVGPWSRHALHGTGCNDRFPCSWRTFLTHRLVSNLHRGN